MTATVDADSPETEQDRDTDTRTDTRTDTDTDTAEPSETGTDDRGRNADDRDQNTDDGDQADPVDPVDPVESPSDSASSGKPAASSHGADETMLIPMLLRPTVREEQGHGQPAVPKSDRWIVLALTAVAIALSATAYGYYVHEHITMAIKDSYSHLEIGRRVISGTTPGIAQLGGVWLPLPHVLQALLAWNWFMYHTGLSGSLISMAAYVIASQAVYRVIRVFDPERAWPAITAAMVFMTNPNVLYMQSTSMDELPFFACTLVAVLYLLRWATTGRPTSLMASGMASFAAMLCRYEAWFLGVLYVITVMVIARKNGHTWRDVRGLGLVASVFGLVIAAAGWLLYNWAIFGNPLNFLDGSESAAKQMAGRTDAEIGHWRVALHGYGTAVIADVGLAVLIAAALGLLLLLGRERLSARSLPLLCLVTLLPFHLYSIESGQFPFGVPDINNDLDNLRFGLPPIVPAALLVGYLFSQLPGKHGKVRLPGWIPATVAAAASVALAAMGAVTTVHHQAAIAAEATNDLGYLSYQAQVADELEHHTSGLILMNAYGNEKALFPVLDRVIYEGSKTTHENIWFQSLADPAANRIQVIVMRFTGPTADDVFRRLHGSPELKDYRLVLQNGQYLVYVRR
ncbi:hypothetical protein ABH926_007803 [Catenulispora sp. GP43]|uniref:glycosyltransferase family 39 protein n=1 Tax=Catenulispora sp. GP43 TaxID=3156263 RepID=UPI00351165AA